MKGFEDTVTLPDSKSDHVPVIADECTAGSLAERVAVQVLLDGVDKTITENIALESFNIFLMEKFKKECAKFEMDLYESQIDAIALNDMH